MLADRAYSAPKTLSFSRQALVMSFGEMSTPADRAEEGAGAVVGLVVDQYVVEPVDCRDLL